MIKLKHLLIEQLRDNGISANVDAFKTVATWDNTFKRFVFQGDVTVSMRVKTLSSSIKRKIENMLILSGESTNQNIDVIEILSFNTPESNQGQGYARKAITSITNIADANNMWIMLEAVPIGNKSLGTHKLVQFYQSAGFKIISYGDRPVLVRPPTQQDFTGIKDTL